MPAPKRVGPFRQAMFLFTVRNRLAGELRSKLDMSFLDARRAAADLDDDIIEQAAIKANNGPPKAIGDGGILQFILDFITSQQFKDLIAFLISLFTQTELPVGAQTPAPAEQPTA